MPLPVQNGHNESFSSNHSQTTQTENVDPLLDNSPNLLPHHHITHLEKFLSYLCFFVLGACILLPWNSLLVSTNYFASRLRQSPFEFTYLNWITVIFTLSNVAFLTRATFAHFSKPTRTILLSLFMILLLSLVLLISTLFEDFSPRAFFSFLMIVTFLEAFGSAYLQNSVIAISSWFGPSCLQGILSGQGANGAFVSLLQLLASLREFKVDSNSTVDHPTPIYISQDKIRNSSYTFYILNTALCIFALLCFTILCKLPFYKFVIKANRSNVIGATPNQADGASDPLLHPSLDHASSLHHPLHTHPPLEPIKPIKLRVVETKIRSLGLSVFFVFFTTLAVFPSITGSILSTHKPTHANGQGTSVLWDNWSNPLIFVPLHFLCFNFGDWLGRIIPQVLTTLSNRLVKCKPALYMMSLARMAFVPLFLLCNVQYSSMVVFNSDFIYFIILSAFSISNGYTSTLLMIAGVAEPTLEPREVDVAATCMSLYLTSGLAVGSFVSFGVKALTRSL